MQWRQEGSALPILILTFRIERFDPVGNRQTPLSVEMRGISVAGVIHDGDEIELNIKGPVDHGVVQTDRVLNRTSASEVRARPAPGMPGSLKAMAPLLIVLGLIIVIFLVMVRRHGGF